MTKQTHLINTNMSAEHIADIKRINDEHARGVCPTCHRTAKIYDYPINQTMVRMLYLFAKLHQEAKKAGEPDADIMNLTEIEAADLIRSNERSQITKLSYYGFVEKQRQADGTAHPSNWRVMPAMYAYLNGAPVPKRVFSYQAEVIDVSEETTTINDIEGIEMLANEFGITRIAPEAGKAIIDTVKAEPEPRPTSQPFNCKYKGTEFGDIKPGEVYEVVIERPVLGGGIVMQKPFAYTYRDLAAFGNAWARVNTSKPERISKTPRRDRSQGH